jgi:hypothetical protein
MSPMILSIVYATTVVREMGVREDMWEPEVFYRTDKTHAKHGANAETSSGH